jgi:hypothetical protein
MKTILTILAALICASLGVQAQELSPQNNLTADQILKEVEKRVSSNDESARIIMIIGESNGASKTREIEIKRKAGDNPKVMVKLQSPADLRGTALLSIGKKGQTEDQWLYLPSTKQTRRIVSGNKNSSFMDSEMSYEDMGSSTDKKFINKLLKTENSPQGGVSVVESKLVGGESSYSRILTWVPMGSFLVGKIEYYDRKGALLKVTEMSDYKKFSGNVWRAQNIQVKNVQNHRTTHLELKDLVINKGLDDQDFSVTSMADE